MVFYNSLCSFIEIDFWKLVRRVCNFWFTDAQEGGQQTWSNKLFSHLGVCGGQLGPSWESLGPSWAVLELPCNLPPPLPPSLFSTRRALSLLRWIDMMMWDALKACENCSTFLYIFSRKQHSPLYSVTPESKEDIRASYKQALTSVSRMHTAIPYLLTLFTSDKLKDLWPYKHTARWLIWKHMKPAAKSTPSSNDWFGLLRSCKSLSESKPSLASCIFQTLSLPNCCICLPPRTFPIISGRPVRTFPINN